MKAYYIHGFESKGLTEEKREKLEALGLEVIAPLFDFRKERNILYRITEEVRMEKPGFLIGSSMGGRMAFYISNRLNVPALLFNPALKSGMIDEIQPVPKDFRELILNPYQQFIFGARDTTVVPASTKAFLEDKYPGTPIREKMLPELEHQIPAAVLEEETKAFIEFLKQQHVN